MPSKKKVKVTCRAAVKIPLGKLIPFQGKLKALSDENYAKMKRAIIKHGFAFPLFVWQVGEKNYCIDGHQRDRVLRRMKKEGYQIPDLPCALIEAKDKKEAKEKVLLAASVYGKATEASLKLFLNDNGMTLKSVAGKIALPSMKLSGPAVPPKPKDTKAKSVAAPVGEYIAITFKTEKICLDIKKRLGMRQGGRRIEWDQFKSMLKIS